MKEVTYSLEQIQSWSPYVEQMCQRFPALTSSEQWAEPWQDGVLYQTVYDEVFASQDDTALKQQLRKARNWQM
ncbi:hypothetical protein MNBD_GAMMA04-1653, partial [hydrothermal vent metagenome]